MSPFFSAPWLAYRGAQAYRAAKYAGAAASAYGAYKQGAKVYRKTFRKRPSPGRNNPSKKRKKVDKRGLKSTGDEGHTMTIGKPVVISTATRQALKDSIPHTFREATTSSTLTEEGRQEHNAHNVELYLNRLEAIASSSATATKSFFVKDLERFSMFTNVTSTPVHLCIYEMSPKIDSISDQSPEVMIASGLEAKYGSSEQKQQPYTEFSESIPFRKRYNIDSKKEVILSPGETHKYSAKFIINKWFASSEGRTYQGGVQSTTAPFYLKDFTKILYAQIMGTPVVDGEKISIAKSKIISTHTVVWKYNVPISTNSNTTIATQNTSYRQDLTNERYINEDTGDVDTNVNA